MTRGIVLITSTIGSSIGWWIGSELGGLFAAFVVSTVTTGIGIYAGKRLAQHWGA